MSHSRRSVLQAGLTGAFGLSLPGLLQQRASAGLASRKTAVIYVEMAGGPTQHETYDPKPLAPAEYRGPLNAIDTAIPGVQFSEFMTEQAKVIDKLAVIRSMHHTNGSHGTSSHLTQTGYYLRDNQNRENEMPCFGSITTKLRGANEPSVPAFVSIPASMRFGRAAWLGKGFNPFETVKSADDKAFEVANLTLLGGLTNERLSDRRALLTGFGETRQLIDREGVADSIDQFTREAFDLVTGDRARTAFDISKESTETRARYGMNSLGQNMLLARRLVEHGITVVTVRASTLGSWDDHGNIADAMKRKGPGFDQAVATLVTDLHDRGLDKDVLVVCMGEFGRTPRINKSAGRDHWGQVMSVVLAGGGLKVGQVIGSSDSTGSVPKDRPYRPENVLAMVYRHLGIEPNHTFTDNSGRPRYVLEERGLIRELV